MNVNEIGKKMKMKKRFNRDKLNAKSSGLIILTALPVLLFIILTIFTLTILSINLITAQTEASAVSTSYCCEKTISGAWCQNAPKESCDETNGLRINPSSCEATSYCKKGYCYDSKEGTCMENAPQKVCELEGGTWTEDTGETPPQCELRCCLIGDQAAFVTPVRCKKLSSLYSLETDFRSDITNEVQCIASASSDVKGACVFEENFETTCRLLTKKECQSFKENYEGNQTKVNFHEGFLCSAEELATNCGPTEETKCIEGKDEVYLVDSCGNLANVYDADRIKDTNYWTKIYDKVDSCGYGKSNGDSKSCGNCDYYLGSTCRAYEVSKDKARPSYGDNICRNLACEYNGQKYEHGETWCASNTKGGIGKESVGGKDFRLVCYNNEVSVEPCAEFKQQLCLQSDVNGFSSAACRQNIWQDCFVQTTQGDCENSDKRDCKWIEGASLANPQEGSLSNQGTTQPFKGTEEDKTAGTNSITGQAIFGGIFGGDDSKDNEDNKNKGACLPLFPPGYDFWNPNGGDAESFCSMADSQCIVKYQKTALGEKECIENCECLDDSWIDDKMEVCVAIGDCGDKVNFVGKAGYDEGYSTKLKKYEPEETSSKK